MIFLLHLLRYNADPLLALLSQTVPAVAVSLFPRRTLLFLNINSWFPVTSPGRVCPPDWSMFTDWARHTDCEYVHGCNIIASLGKTAHTAEPPQTLPLFPQAGRCELFLFRAHLLDDTGQVNLPIINIKGERCRIFRSWFSTLKVSSINGFQITIPSSAPANYPALLDGFLTRGTLKYSQLVGWAAVDEGTIRYASSPTTPIEPGTICEPTIWGQYANRGQYANPMRPGQYAICPQSLSPLCWWRREPDGGRSENGPGAAVSRQFSQSLHLSLFTAAKPFGTLFSSSTLPNSVPGFVASSAFPDDWRLLNLVTDTANLISLAALVALGMMNFHLSMDAGRHCRTAGQAGMHPSSPSSHCC